jgi:hypothetical protein
VTLQSATRKQKQTQQKKKHRRRSRRGDESEEGEETEESDSDTQRGRKRIRTKKKTPLETTNDSRMWSDEEDTLLRELYGLYAGSHSVFDVIALNTPFM